MGWEGEISKGKDIDSRKPIHSTEAPFLVQVLFSLLSTTLPLLPLAKALARARKGQWNLKRTVFWATPSPDSDQSLTNQQFWSASTGALEGLGEIQVMFQGDNIISFSFSKPWPRVATRRGTNFLPSACRIPLLPGTHILDLKERDASYLSQAMGEWTRTLGTLSAELRIVLEGNYSISRSALPLTPVFLRNHPSWERDPKARAALWPVLAQYLIKGQFEYVADGARMPLCILPIGAVPKNTDPFYRLILDCRYVNQFIDPWPVRYLSMAGLSLLIGRNSFMYLADLSAAYLLTRLGGCGQEKIPKRRFATNLQKKGYYAWEGETSGCDASTCGGCCDKSAIAICADGHVMRAGCTPFGMAVSHGTLTIITDALQQYFVRRKKIGMGTFVDDMMFLIKVIWHALCAGYEGRCPICMEAVPRTEEAQRFTFELLDRFHLEVSEKCLTFSQQQVFMGIIINSNRGLYTLTEKKMAKLARDLEEVCGTVHMSPRNCSKVRGKLQNYSFCMQRIRSFSIPFNLFIGGPTCDREWDTEKEISDDMRSAASFLLRHLDTLVRLGAPIWVQQACTVYDKFMRQALSPNIQDAVSVLTYDASEFGAGYAIRESPEEVMTCLGARYSEISTVSTFTEPLTAQIHREAMAGLMGLEILRKKRPIAGRIIIFRNDCQSGLYGLNKGSNSKPIQHAAINIAKICIEEGAFPLFLHVSGKKLIDEGVDAGSREHAQTLQGPACGDVLRKKIFKFAEDIGVTITVDMFAAASNRLVDRYMSWTEEPESEVIDCFSARSWNYSLCPHCNQQHRETGFYFAPNNLEDGVIRRARSDGARGIFLVPNSAKQGFWQALTREATHSLENIAEHAHFTHTRRRVMCKHSLFYADFSEGPSEYFVPPCLQAWAHRGRANYNRASEEKELELIQRELQWLDEPPDA